MLTSLRVQGYRGFQAFSQDTFGRINLIVGRNNAGKSALLEAMELLLRGDTALALWEQPIRRNERLPSSSDTEPVAAIRHLFAGGLLRPGVELKVEGVLTDEGGAAPRSLWAQIQDDAAPQNGAGRSPRGASKQLWLTYQSDVLDTLTLTPAGGLAKPAFSAGSERSPVCFLPPNGWIESAFVALWEDMVLTDTEADVIRALQIIEPRVERIAASHDSFVIRLRDGDDRLPLGAMGDGARRILALAIQLARAKGGALLVDEIDNGLHYSVMQQVWKLLIGAARRLGIQIFATSHSLDCLQALAAVSEEEALSPKDVFVHRVEAGNASLTSYSAKELRVAVAQEMEIR